MLVLVFQAVRPGFLKLNYTLRQAGISSHLVDSGDEGMATCGRCDYDAMIIHGNLTDMSGLKLLRRIRKADISTPILCLCEDEQPELLLEYFSIGADDVVWGHCADAELIARIEALIRRNRGHSEPIVKVGRLEINLHTKCAMVGNVPVSLSRREFEVLEILALKKGRALSKDMIMDHLYGGIDEPHVKVIDVHICKLRKKLSKATSGQYLIKTIWGRGYLLSDDDGTEPQDRAEQDAA